MGNHKENKINQGSYLINVLNSLQSLRTEEESFLCQVLGPGVLGISPVFPLNHFIELVNSVREEDSEGKQQQFLVKASELEFQVLQQIARGSHIVRYCEPEEQVVKQEFDLQAKLAQRLLGECID